MKGKRVMIIAMNPILDTQAEVIIQSWVMGLLRGIDQYYLLFNFTPLCVLPVLHSQRPCRTISHSPLGLVG